MYHDLSFLSELPLKTSVLGTTKKLHQCSGTIEILDKERRDQNVSASPHKGSTTCSGPGNVYKWVFKASVQYFVFFSRSQAVALTVPIFRHTNHSFPYCVFKTRSFTPLLTMDVTHPVGAYVSQGSKRGRSEAASKSSHKLFSRATQGNTVKH